MLCLLLTWGNQKKWPYSNGNIYTQLEPPSLSLEGKASFQVHEINSNHNIFSFHLNVRLPISLLNMSQNYASDFSSLLNISQYLLPKRVQSSAFSSVLSICAYLVQRLFIIPLNQTFMRPNNNNDIFFRNQRLVTKNFCCYWFLFL